MRTPQHRGEMREKGKGHPGRDGLSRWNNHQDCDLRKAIELSEKLFDCVRLRPISIPYPDEISFLGKRI
jgi:hypothetical protein